MPSIAIIGGGVAGIAAAQRLLQARPDWQIRVFERANRLGGRALTDSVSIPGFAFDKGSVYLQDSATNPLTAIAQRLQFATTPEPNSDAWLRVQGVDGPVNLNEFEPSFALVTQQIEANFNVAAERDDEEDFKYPNATVTPQPVLATPMLQFGFGVSQYGAFSESAETWQYLAADSARQVSPEPASGNLYVDRGIGTLVQTWGEQVLADHAVLGAQVTQLALSADAVTVHWLQGEQPQQGAFDACIVTLPVAVMAARDVTFDPPLPAPYLQALQSLRLGSYKKFALAMAQVPGDLNSADNTYYLTQGGLGLPGPSGVWQVFRVPQPDGATPVLLVHAAGDFAAQLDALGDAAAFELCTARLQLAWPELRLNPEQRAVTNWNANPLCRGAYSYTRPSPGLLAQDTTALQARINLGEPLERLHFAGEATSTACYGTLQAAYFEGERAADAVVAQLMQP